jgi:diamine N-acetyltransferase
MKIYTRDFKDSDAEVVGDIGTKSWFYTYNDIFSKEYIENRMKINYSPENIRKSAANTDLSNTFVCELNNDVVGFIQVSYYNYWDKETFDPSRIMISRLYIYPEYIGKGIGSALLQRAEEWIKDKGFNEYYLYVEQSNKLGFNFYMRKGFKIDQEANSDNEVFLKKTLN